MGERWAPPLVLRHDWLLEERSSYVVLYAEVGGCWSDGKSIYREVYSEIGHIESYRSRSLKVIQSDTVRSVSVTSLLVIYSNYISLFCTVSGISSDISRNTQIFRIPHVFNASLRVLLSFAADLSQKKN